MCRVNIARLDVRLFRNGREFLCPRIGRRRDFGRHRVRPTRLERPTHCITQFRGFKSAALNEHHQVNEVFRSRVWPVAPWKGQGVQPRRLGIERPELIRNFLRRCMLRVRPPHRLGHPLRPELPPVRGRGWAFQPFPFGNAARVAGADIHEFT
jgi:hypothetical protein